MSDIGYVYVLVNPSFPNMVKIGKTKNDPEERAKDLSSSGVPTHFIVCYHIYVSQMTQVEREIHLALENLGIRVNKQREFFEMKPKEAIDVVVKIGHNFFLDEDTSNVTGASISISEEDHGNLWDEVENKANEKYLGIDTFKDLKGAYKLYQEAADLGSVDAMEKLGMMNLRGESREANASEAMYWFKKAHKTSRSEMKLFGVGLCYHQKGLFEFAIGQFKRVFTCKEFKSLGSLEKGELISDFLVTFRNEGLEVLSRAKICEELKNYEKEFVGYLYELKKRVGPTSFSIHLDSNHKSYRYIISNWDIFS